MPGASRKPPKSLKPRANVIVRLCSIECCFAHPLDGCPEKSNTLFMEDLRGWNRLTQRLYVWDYTCNYNHFQMPFPNLDVLDDNMRTFRDHGVVGMFPEGNATFGGELGELRAWVLAQLMWDPNLEADALIREYVGAVYGPVAGPVMEFIDLQRTAIRETGDHVRIFESPDKYQYLSDDWLAKYDAKLEQIEKGARASGDEVLIKRALRLRLPIWYTRYAQKRLPKDVLRPQARRLVETMRELNYTHIDAWTISFPPFAEKVDAYLAEP